VASNDVVTTVPGTLVDQTGILADSDAFPALFGQPLTVRITTTLPFTVPNQNTDWDRVRVDATPIPEPASAALLAVGAAGACVRGRRRRRTHS
jgi:hypothetical protein